jgi:hypothetical protein
MNTWHPRLRLLSANVLLVAILIQVVMGSPHCHWHPQIRDQKWIANDFYRAPNIIQFHACPTFDEQDNHHWLVDWQHSPRSPPCRFISPLFSPIGGESADNPDRFWQRRSFPIVPCACHVYEYLRLPRILRWLRIFSNGENEAEGLRGAAAIRSIIAAESSLRTCIAVRKIMRLYFPLLLHQPSRYLEMSVWIQKKVCPKNQELGKKSIMFVVHCNASDPRRVSKRPR